MLLFLVPFFFFDTDITLYTDRGTERSPRTHLVFYGVCMAYSRICLVVILHVLFFLVECYLA